MQAITIPLSTIHLDLSHNARVVYGDLEALGEDIKVNGQITPILVAERKGLPKGAKYLLIGGYRRVQAMAVVGLDSVRAQVHDGSDSALALLNAKENIARKNLTTYELALTCQNLKQLHKMSGDRVAKELAAGEGQEGRLTKNYINRLTALLERLAPGPLKAWSEAHPAASINKLEEIRNLNHPEQEEAWAKVIGGVADAELGGEAGGGSQAGNAAPASPPSRPTKAQVQRAAEMATEADLKDVAAALLWTLQPFSPLKIGRSTVYDAKKEEERLAAEKEAARLAKEEADKEARITAAQKALEDAKAGKAPERKGGKSKAKAS